MREKMEPLKVGSEFWALKIVRYTGCGEPVDSCWIGAALKKADALEKKETRKP